MTKVSFITCAFNREATIAQTIESVLKQTYKDWEMIVCDDGSTDKTAQIVKDYEDRYPAQIKYIHQENQGPGAARNAAINASCGEYVAILDSDDLATEDRLAKQVAFLDANPEIILTGANAHVFVGDKKVVRDIVFAHSNEEIQKCMLDENQFVHSSVMIRKKYLDEFGLYREELKSSQDYELLLRLSQQGKVANMDEYLCWFRLNPGSISLSSNTEQKKNYELISSTAREKNLKEVKAFDVPEPVKTSGYQKRAAKAAGHYHWAIRLLQLGHVNESREFAQIALALKPINTEIWRFYVKHFIFGKKIS